jgi:hypothetical protein
MPAVRQRPPSFRFKFDQAVAVDEDIIADRDETFKL